MRFELSQLCSFHTILKPQVGGEDSGTDYYRVLEGLGQPDSSQASGAEVIEDRLPTTPHILYQESNGKVEQEREKSLNQNVFGKKVLVLPKPSEGLVYDEETFNADVFQGEEGTLQVSFKNSPRLPFNKCVQVVQGFKPGEELGEEVRQQKIDAK